MATAARIREAASALASVRLDLNSKAQRVLLAQALTESQFGDVLKTPDGSRSHNWGMIYHEGDLGTIPQGDTADGKPFTANAAWNSSDEVGAKQLADLISNSYGPAMGYASAGDLFGYARALFRDNKMPYYGGFPPGHKWSLAPAGTKLHSDLDHFYRVLAYKRMLESGYRAVSSALGVAMDANTTEPSTPTLLQTSTSPTWPWWVAGLSVVGGTVYYGYREGWFQGASLDSVAQNLGVRRIQRLLKG